MTPDSFPSYRLSIITVVRNDSEGLRRTMISVARCKGKHTEYLVIDGASTDGTLAVTGEPRGLIDRLVSEPDDGIYDAMNKGIALAQGDYLMFLNAGDELLINPDELLAGIKNQPVIVYGRANMRMPDGTLSYVKGKRLKSVRRFLKGMPLCHQAILYRRDAMEAFDLQFRIMADRVLTYGLLKRHGLKKAAFVDRIFVDYLEGGYSGTIPPDVWRREEDLFYRESGNYHYIVIKRINRLFRRFVRDPLRRFKCAS